MENSSDLKFELYQAFYYDDLKEIMQVCFNDLKGQNYSTFEEIEIMSSLYPRGQIICTYKGKLIGANLSRIVPFDRYKENHTQLMCSDQNLFIDDAINGDSVYGLDVFVHPEYRYLKVGKTIVEKFIQNVYEDNFKCMMGISRIPDYIQYKNELTCEEYVQKILKGELVDKVLNFHLKCDAQIININPNFNPDDEASDGYGVLLSYPNDNYNPQKEINKGEMIRTILKEELVLIN